MRQVARLVESGKTFEHDGALWLKTNRLRRRQGPRGEEVGRRVHVFRARRRIPRDEVGARVHDGDQHPGIRSPQHGDARARGAAGDGESERRRATRTTCCTRW
jgi:hypothetical protein